MMWDKMNERAGSARVYASAVLNMAKNERMLCEASTYCMFLSFPRSGTTLVGALLDAHPNILIANEANGLEMVRRGFGKRLIFSTLVERNRTFVRSGYRGHGGYVYGIPNQWQGKQKEVHVIGDKRGIFESKDIPPLERLMTLIEDVRLIHVVRNPYDCITTHFLKSTQRSLRDHVENFFDVARTIVQVQEIGAAIHCVRHEDLARSHEVELASICRFLGEGAPKDYLHDCASVVKTTPHVSRCNVEWPSDLISEVERRMDEFKFLDGYHFDT